MKALTIYMFFCTFWATYSKDIVFKGSSRRPQGRVIVSAIEPICELVEAINGEKTLLCYCKFLEELHLGYGTLSSGVIYRRYGEEDANGLEIVLCKKVFIHSDFSWLNLPRYSPIGRLNIKGAQFLYLTGPRTLDFSFQKDPVSIHISKLGNSLSLPSLNSIYFGGNITKLYLESLFWEDFNSNVFQGISKNTEVDIVNCSIRANDPGSLSRRIKLTQLKIERSNIEGAGRGTFNLSIPLVMFSDSHIELIAENAFEMTNGQVYVFKNCTLGVSSKSLHLKSDQIIFDNVTLREPKSLSLHGLTPVTGKGQIFFRRVLLIDPSRGTLVSGFHEPVFESIKVSTCLCGLEDYLLDATESYFTLRMLPEAEAHQQEKLKNNTECYDSHTGNFTKLHCDVTVESSLDGAYVAIIVILLLGIIGAISIFGFLHYANEKKRNKTIKYWTMVLPRPKSYRETIVRFNLESAEPLSTPVEVDYLEQINEPDLVQGLTKPEISQEDDQIKPNMEDTFVNNPSVEKDDRFQKALSTILEEDLYTSSDLQPIETFVCDKPMAE